MIVDYDGNVLPYDYNKAHRGKNEYDNRPINVEVEKNGTTVTTKEQTIEVFKDCINIKIK